MDKVRQGERCPSTRFSVGKRILTQTIGNKPGPDRATTTVGEDVSLSLRAGGKVRVQLVNEETRKFPDELFSPQRTKNHHKKRRFVSNSPRPPVEEKLSVDFARVVTLPQNAHTRTAFPSSMRVAPVCRMSPIGNRTLTPWICRNPSLPGRRPPQRRSIDYGHRWQVRPTEYAWWTRRYEGTRREHAW